MVTPATADTIYEPVVGWPLIPHPMSFHEATSVAVDSQDRVYIFNRGAWPMMVFDKGGQFINTWGTREDFGRPHSVTVDSEDNLYLADGNHTVHKRTQTGEPI
ncbi:MAG: peptidylglycine alpha-amidating monooxygenase, partial [Dehalococcoidia bacterium]